MPSLLPQILVSKRNMLGMTQEQVALAIGKGLRTYIYYEDGETTPKHETLLKLAEILKFDLQDIYEDAGKLHYFNHQPPPSTAKTKHVKQEDIPHIQVLLRLASSNEKLSEANLRLSEANLKLANGNEELILITKRVVPDGAETLKKLEINLDTLSQAVLLLQGKGKQEDSSPVARPIGMGKRNADLRSGKQAGKSLRKDM